MSAVETSRTRSRSLAGARARSLLLLLAVTVAWGLVLPRLRVTTAITHFLPQAEDRRAAQLMTSIADSELSRTLVLDVSGDDPDRLAETARKLMAALRDDAETAEVRSGVDEDAQRRIFQTFEGRSPTALLGPEALSDDAVAERLEQLKTRLASPMGPLVRQLAPRDPLSGLLGTLEGVADVQGSELVSRGGVLFSSDEKHAFVFATSRKSAFDAPAQRPWLARIDTSFAAARGQIAQRLERSGVAPFAVASEAQIRGDIERIGTLSTVGILLLFALVFRSVRMLGLGMLPLWFGSALAIVLSHVVFGELHGLTLAFGTSLLGVGIDYAEHYFAHFALTPEQGAARVMKGVWPGLWMGAVTTTIGLAGLGLTSFPGIREIAFFSTVAIFGALLGTRWLLPPWMPASYKQSRHLAALARVAERGLGHLRRRRWLVGLPALLLVLAVPGLARTRFVDDVSVLIALDPALVAEDSRVRERVSPVDPGRFAVVVHPDEELALDALGRTTRALEIARRDGLVAGYTPLGSLLRSRATQLRTFALARAKRERLAEIFREHDFVAEAFAPFFEALAGPEPAPLTLEELRASPLGAVIGPLAPRVPQGQAFVVPLRGVRDVDALRARLSDAIVIDESATLEATYARVRRHTTAMLFVGLGLVFGTLVWRYRSLRLSLAAFAPAALAALVTVSAFGWVGAPLNLLHFVGLLLVLSMGVDYGIFVVEGRASPEHEAHALVSVATATSTTLLSFGLLALSPSPALRALGVTITLGLLASAALCPTALALLGRNRKEILE